MTEDACILNEEQRRVVESTVTEHCRIRGWTLHAVSCRTTHVHVVVTANRKPAVCREQFKAWGTRKLKALDPKRKTWWAERGWAVFIDDERGLFEVIRYVTEGQ